MNDSYNKLIQGNKLFSDNKTLNEPDYFKNLSLGQTPEYLWIGCSDSRVPANEITSTQSGEVFAKIPTATQLQCDSSDNYAPSKANFRADLQKCDDFACGAVVVASETGCTWWEVKSTFEQIDLKTGKIEATLGTLRTVAQRTKPKAIQSIMLVSEIKHRDADGKVLNNIKASGLEVSCHHDAAPDLTIRNVFKAN